MKDYKKLIVWKKAHALVLATYEITKSFPKQEMYNLTSQLRRAAASIPTNIAEGCGKHSQLDFARYLQNAQGSAQEIEYLAFLCFELRYLSMESYEAIDSKIQEVKAILISFIAKVRRDLRA